MDTHPICLLAQGNVTHWRGLAKTRYLDLPACLGAVVERGVRRIRDGTLAWHAYRPSGKNEVYVGWWMNGGQVELIEVRLVGSSLGRKGGKWLVRKGKAKWSASRY